jgi:hypothetical protein
MSFIVSTLGFIFIVVSLYDIYRASACRTWSTITGKVIMAGVRAEIASKKKHAAFYYTYKVNDVEYLGTRVVFGDSILQMISFLFAKFITAKYTEGQDVTVYYNPASHAVCVLEPGITWHVFASIGVGVIFMLIAPTL